MSKATQPPNEDEDIPPEIDFSDAVRGKFYRPSIKLNLPVYLDFEVQEYLAAIASKKGVPLSELANKMLRKEIEILETVK